MTTGFRASSRGGQQVFDSGTWLDLAGYLGGAHSRLFGPDRYRLGVGRDSSASRSPDGLVKLGHKQNCQLWHALGGLTPSRAPTEADTPVPVNFGWPESGVFALSGEKTEDWLGGECAYGRAHGRDQIVGYTRRRCSEDAAGRGFDSPQVHPLSVSLARAPGDSSGGFSTPPLRLNPA